MNHASAAIQTAQHNAWLQIQRRWMLLSALFRLSQLYKRPVHSASAVNQRRKSSKFHSSIFLRFRAPSRPQINSFIILKIVDHSIPVGKLANSFQQLWPVAKQKSGFKIKVKISMKCHKSAIDLWAIFFVFAWMI